MRPVDADLAPIYLNAEACEQIKHMPTIRIERSGIKHGSWKKIEGSTDLFDYWFKCSICKRETPRRAFPISPDYCPYCGAKMV